MQVGRCLSYILDASECPLHDDWSLLRVVEKSVTVRKGGGTQVSVEITLATPWTYQKDFSSPTHWDTYCCDPCGFLHFSVNPLNVQHNLCGALAQGKRASWSTKNKRQTIAKGSRHIFVPHF